jgi:hypothetical protein
MPTYDREIQPLLAKYCVQCHAHDGEKLGGVELDTYETAKARRVHNVCVSVTQVVIDRFAADLIPLRLSNSTTSSAAAGQAPCRDDRPGGELRAWEPYSMPVGARSGMLLDEQVIFARWVELDTPR